LHKKRGTLNAPRRAPLPKRASDDMPAEKTYETTFPDIYKRALIQKAKRNILTEKNKDEVKEDLFRPARAENHADNISTKKQHTTRKLNKTVSKNFKRLGRWIFLLHISHLSSPGHVRRDTSQTIAVLKPNSA